MVEKLGAETVELEVADGTRMRAHTMAPRGSARAGAIVLQEAFGVNAHIRELASRLAAAGYATIAPELFHRTAPPGFEGSYGDFAGVMPHYKALTREGLEADLRAAAAWLDIQGHTRQVAVGFCLGGRAAALAAATVPLRAAASFYGGDLPSLRDRVPAIAAPLLLVWGDRDAHITPAVRAEFADLLRAQKKEFIETTFSDAGHGFLREAHSTSAARAWEFLLVFFASALAN